MGVALVILACIPTRRKVRLHTNCCTETVRYSQNLDRLVDSVNLLEAGYPLKSMRYLGTVVRTIVPK